MLLVELVLTTLCGFLFTAGIAAQAGRIALLLVLGTIGFAAAGCVFSAALLRSRSRDVLLSTLLYPIIVPIVIAGARGTSQLLDPISPDLDGALLLDAVPGRARRHLRHRRPVGVRAGRRRRLTPGWRRRAPGGRHPAPECFL